MQNQSEFTDEELQVFVDWQGEVPEYEILEWILEQRSQLEIAASLKKIPFQTFLNDYFEKAEEMMSAELTDDERQILVELHGEVPEDEILEWIYERRNKLLRNYLYE